MPRSLFPTTIVLVASLLLVSPVAAQEQHTQHTKKLAAGQRAAPARVEDMAWLAGRWVGEGMGGQSEEVWAPVSLGRMLGTFTQSEKGRPLFHELMVIMELDGRLLLRLKHFNPDLTGWEEKDRFVDFAFVAKTDDALYFSGLTYQRVGRDGLTIYLAMREGGGALREETFTFRRAR